MPIPQTTADMKLNDNFALEHSIVLYAFDHNSVKIGTYVR